MPGANPRPRLRAALVDCARSSPFHSWGDRAIIGPALSAKADDQIPQTIRPGRCRLGFERRLDESKRTHRCCKAIILETYSGQCARTNRAAARTPSLSHRIHIEA